MESVGASLHPKHMMPYSYKISLRQWYNTKSMESHMAKNTWDSRGLICVVLSSCVDGSSIIIYTLQWYSFCFINEIY